MAALLLRGCDLIARAIAWANRLRHSSCNRDGDEGRADSVTDSGGTFAPLREPVFRTIWSASLLSNFGQLILGVGAAWEMTRMTGDPTMVALVQSAMMLPLMLVSVPAGAIADMFDRRKVAMAGLGFAMLSAASLTMLELNGLATPWVLLSFCFLIGTGVALYSPAWQASISEQVSTPRLPAAIALGTISNSVARSIGPAIGGLVVLAAGAQAAFAINAVGYIPLLLAFLFWRRASVPSRLPPESITRAIQSGARYVTHSRPIRVVLIRAFLFGMAGSTGSALAPLIARDLLDGDAATFGILLGASGVGAVIGALFVAQARVRLGTERATALLATIYGLAMIVVGLSHSLILTCAALVVAGAVSILAFALYNVVVQLAAPRWVTARALSLFGAAVTGGIAIGAWLWGMVAAHWGISVAVVASGVALLAQPLLGWAMLRLPDEEGADVTPHTIAREPEVAMDISLRSGPINIAIDYRVSAENARAYYDAMRSVQRVRMRNGGFGWSLARDIADPELWTERYNCPTWGDYLRLRDRFTESDAAAQAAADALMVPGWQKIVRRRLERPFGSVRWRADTPDIAATPTTYLGP
jgi:MFS family permease